MKIKINNDKCIGCNTCESLCPKVFEINQTKLKANIKKDADLDKNKNCIKESMEACPVEAIIIR